MGFGTVGFTKGELRENLVGADLKPPIYRSVNATGTIVSFTPSSGMYPILVLFQGTTNTDGNTIELQALDSNNNWRTFLRVRFLGNLAFAMGFPAMRLDKVNSGGIEYDVMAGDGTTATLRAIAGGAGVWDAFLWVGES